MSGLQEQIVEYLRADGFKIALDGALIHAMRAQELGDTDIPETGNGDDYVVWPVEDQEAASLDNQKRFLDMVARTRAQKPATQGIYVAPKGTSFAGIETLIRAYGFDRQSVIKRRAPIQYFDTPYVQDEQDGREVRSVIDAVLTNRSIQRRIAQPFAIRKSIDWSGAPAADGADLLDHLFKEMSAPVKGPKVRIIDGPAGGGKSHLFDAVFSKYYQFFIESKRSHDFAPRPVLFLPDHLTDKSVTNMGELMNAVFESDLAAPVTKEQFRWLLTNGFSNWMFDGLDEFYAGETDFFPFIERTLEEEGSKAQFLICTRNSLLNTSGRLTDFVERILARDPTQIDLYQLLPWGENEWAQLADRPRRSLGFMEIGRPESTQFIRALKNSKHLYELASLPFYSDCILRYWREHGKRMPNDVFVILERLIDDMLMREKSKLPFDWRVFASEQEIKNVQVNDGETVIVLQEDAQTPLDEQASRDTEKSNGEMDEAKVAAVLEAFGTDALIEFLGAVAHFRRRFITAQEGKGFELEIGDLIEIFIDSQVLPPDQAHLQETYRTVLLAIIQFAFFVPGEEKGTLDFGHDQIAEYLAARYTVRLVRQQPDCLEEALGTAELVPGSLYVRYLQREFRKNKALRQKLESLLEPELQSAM